MYALCVCRENAKHFFSSAMIFDRSAIKIVDIAKIIYILNSPVTTASFSPVTKLDRRHLKLYVSPTIVSTDDKTYPRTVRRITTKAPKRTPPPPPARPAQVVVDTVTTFYKQHDVHPASHNAVIEMMSPEMRRRLRTRRMRGGAMSSGLLHTLKVWVLVTFLLLILSRLWNIFPVLLFLAFTSRSG